MPVCACGGQKFRTAGAGKSRSGKRTYAVVCLTCGNELDVSKTAYALCNYLATRAPSEAFLNLYQLER